MKLSEEDYYQKIRLAILVAFDIIVINDNDEVLLGRRRNAPAKGLLFTPGGNVYKGETFEQAIRRISGKELGFEISLKDVRLSGIYDQRYKENFRDSKFPSCYIDFAFEYKLKRDKIGKENFLAQHSEMVWMKKKEILKNKEIHKFVKSYFIKDAENKLACLT